MLIHILFVTIAVGFLSGCDNVAGKPLPMVDKADPTWSLAPDHLENGGLPK
jgi:hypothetical protein